jgi:hypothetical protein
VYLFFGRKVLQPYITNLTQTQVSSLRSIAIMGTDIWVVAQKRNQEASEWEVVPYLPPR